MAPHVGGRPGGHRHHRRLRRRRLPAGRRRRRRACWSADRRDHRRWPIASAPCRPMDVAGRADRLAGAAAPRPGRRAARHQAGQPPLPHRVHRVGRPACWSAPTSCVFVTDGRYREQAADQLAAAGVDARHRDHRHRAARSVVRRGRCAGAARLGLEADARDLGRSSARYAETWFPDAELVRHQRAGRAAAPGEGRRRGRPHRGGRGGGRRRAGRRAPPARSTGSPSRSSASSSTPTMRRLGADRHLASRPSSASGPNGAKPHPGPSARRIAEGDLVVLDFGALVDGYCSDMTRTVDGRRARRRPSSGCSTWSPRPRPAGVDAVRAGVAAGDVDAACRDGHRRRRLGRRLPARHRPRRRPRHPRGAVGGGDGRCYARRRPRRHRRAGCLPPRARRRARRGHRRRHRRRVPAPHPHAQGPDPAA